MKTFTLLALTGITLMTAQADWLQFRGPNGSGYVKADLPTEPAISWKLDLPGKGLSSPIVVGDRVYVTSSSGPTQERLHIFCFQASDGKKVWERQFYSTGRTMCHDKTAVAAPSPVSDGERILALFSSNDLFCLDLDGNLLWLRGLTNDYPNASNSLGLASSPIIADGVLIAQIENDSESFSAGIDLKHGKNLWKKPRAKRANWTSPIAIKSTDGKELAALQGSDGVDIVRPTTGEVVWSYGESASTIPSSAADAQGNLYIPSQGLTAVKPGPDGGSEQLWRVGSMRPGTASPLVHGDRIYVITNANVLTCGDLANGDRLWRLRLKGPFGSCPIATDSHLYTFNEAGLVQVIELGGEEGKVVGTLDLGEMLQCTPAVAHNAIFVRSNSHLWKLAKP
ncbi:MAG: outer membrane protein assembly factor BamB [Verrucomicrobiales bacterium]|jgi:outer membrane protein assembly factor BamB